MSYTTKPTKRQLGILKEYYLLENTPFRTQLIREVEVKIGLIPNHEELVRRINEPDPIINLILKNKEIEDNNQIIYDLLKKIIKKKKKQQLEQAIVKLHSFYK